MEAKTDVKMLQDEAVLNLRKLQYKYTKKEVDEFLELQRQGAYEKVNLLDFNGNKLSYFKSFLQVNSILVKKLALPRKEYGKQAMETEVYATLDIESIHSSRESIKKIFKCTSQTACYLPLGYSSAGVNYRKLNLCADCQSHAIWIFY